MDLTAFLLARYDDIERPAEKAHRYEHDALRFASALHALESIDPGMGRHFASQSPAHVLADIAAKRQVVELHSIQVGKSWTNPIDGPGRYEDEFSCRICGWFATEDGGCDTVRLLALPFASHPNYDETWRPS